MADANDLAIKVPHAAAFGNVGVATAEITTAAATNGDLFRFLKLPAHTRLLDLKVVNTASSASTTMQFGYASVDGTDVDADYFAAATSIASASVIRASAANAPKTVDREFYITGTLGGANIATSTTITVVAIYEYLHR